MKKIVNLTKYKETREEYKKAKIILKNLLDLDKAMKECISKLGKYMKYKPGLEAINTLTIKRVDLVTYIKQYKKIVDEYDGNING